MTLQFSLFLPVGFAQELGQFDDPVAAAERLVDLVKTAEEVGFEAVWLPDHLQTIPPSQAYLFESWTTLAALAGQTSRIRIGQLVSANGYRNPALQAKMASTVDVLSKGRLTFGIGAGWYQPDYDAFGYEFPDGPDRLRELREAVQIIQSLWTQDVTNFDGSYYRVSGAMNQPRGVQQPRIPMMIAGGGEQVTLKLVAEFADACNVMESPAGVERKFAILKRHCETVGRDYDTILRTATNHCLMTDTDELAREALPQEMGAFYPGDFGSYLLYGTADTIRRRIAAYEAVGVQQLAVGFHQATETEAIRRFAKEFIG